MICEARANKYCRDDISKIENYDKAVADATQTWVCHHRDEVKILSSGIAVVRSAKDLAENGRYYNCPANELIFLTKSEHGKLHSAGKNNPMYGRTNPMHGKANPMYGKHHSAETKQKMSEAQKGKNNPMYGRTGERNPMYGKTRSEETRRKIAESQKAYWAKRKAEV